MYDKIHYKKIIIIINVVYCKEKKKRGLDLIKMNFLYPLLINDILERDQEVPMPHRSRNEEMSLEKFEFV